MASKTIGEVFVQNGRFGPHSFFCAHRLLITTLNHCTLSKSGSSTHSDIFMLINHAVYTRKSGQSTNLGIRMLVAIKAVGGIASQNNMDCLQPMRESQHYVSFQSFVSPQSYAAPN